jgi:hypothetical protein
MNLSGASHFSASRLRACAVPHVDRRALGQRRRVNTLRPTDEAAYRSAWSLRGGGGVVAESVVLGDPGRLQYDPNHPLINERVRASPTWTSATDDGLMIRCAYQTNVPYSNERGAPACARIGS